MNLLSISKICSKGLKVIFDANSCQVINHDGEVYATGTHENGLYVFDSTAGHAMVSRSTSEINLWHRRTGHLNVDSLRKLKAITTGMNFADSHFPTCIPCIKGKHARAPFPPSGEISNVKLELVHGDLCGPMEAASIAGSRYIFTLVDDATSKMFTYFLKSKKEVTEVFMEFKNEVENQTGLKIKHFRSDNGTGFVNQSMKSLFKKFGIIHQLSVPYTNRTHS